MFLKIGQLIQMVLYYVDDEYRNLHPDLAKESFHVEQCLIQALRIAEINGLLYSFCSKLLKEPRIKEKRSLIKTRIRNENEKLLLLKKTLGFIKGLFESENLDFMFIKLYRGIPYAPRDVDILIRHNDMSNVISLLKRNNFDVEVLSEVEIQCRRADLLKVDLYCGFYYLSIPFIGEEFLWRNPRIVNIQGFDCPIPNFEADLLSMVIHSLLGHRHLTLLDFLYAKNLLKSEQLSLNKTLEEAERYGWAHAFTEILYTLEGLYKSLYSSPNFPNEISFPFVYPTKFVFKAFQGFASLPINVKTKLFFALSAFLDATYHKYLYVKQAVSFELPKQLKKIIDKNLYKVRQRRGDRKIIHE